MRQSFLHSALAVAGVSFLLQSCETSARHNSLSDAEIADGWELLFNGVDLSGWTEYATQ